MARASGPMMMNRRAFLGAAAALAAVSCSKSKSPDLWFTYGGKNREVLLRLVDQFLAEHPSISLKPVFQGDYWEGLAKLRASLYAGSPPAITHVVGEVLPYLVHAGALEPLDGELTSDLVLPLSQAGTFRGGPSETYGIPFNRSTPIAYFNGRILDELKLAPPTTWFELRQFAARATQRSGDSVRRWGFSCPIDWWFWVALVAQAGGEVFDEAGVPTLGGPAGVEALEFWRTLVHDDRTMKPPPGRDYNAWQAANVDFLSGNVAMIWTSTAFLRYLEESAGFPVVAAPLPRHRRAAVPTGGTFFVIPRGTAGPALEAANAFLHFMVKPTQANAWATATGYMTVSREGMNALESSGALAHRPNDRIAYDQLASSVAWPWSPALLRVQREAVQPRLEEAILGSRAPADVLRDALTSLETA